MSETRNKIVANVKKITSETSTFPLVCETCMGDDPYVRMTKMDAGSACQMCERPFTVFRWKAGNRGRFKATVICQVCAKLKNVCQCCLLDLEFGLPIQVRDKYLAENERVAVATSQQGIDFQVQQAAALMASGSIEPLAIESGYSRLADNPHLQRIARTAPYYERNEARVCSFFQKGECTRGETCPFRHEAGKSEFGKQSIRDRILGRSDPVAEKMVSAHDARLAAMPKADESVTTLFVANLSQTTEESCAEKFLRSEFTSFGQILGLKVVKRANCAFVEFQARESAERALMAKFGNPDFALDGNKLKVSWAKPKIGAAHKSSLPYPSMDPANMGDAPHAGGR